MAAVPAWRHAIWRAVGRIPFTLLMLGVLIAFGIAMDSPMHRLPPQLLAPLAYAPNDLTHPAEWWRLVVSAGGTEGGRAFWGALLGVIFFAGPSEWRAGTAWAAATFWGAHLGALLAQSLLFAFPMVWLHLLMGTELAASAGVGASAGYLGSLGLLIATLSRRWSRPVACGVSLLLIVLIALPVGAGEGRAVWLSDGVAHLVAFVLGFGAGRVQQHRARTRTPAG